MMREGGCITFGKTLFEQLFILIEPMITSLKRSLKPVLDWPDDKWYL